LPCGGFWASFTFVALLCFPDREAGVGEIAEGIGELLMFGYTNNGVK